MNVKSSIFSLIVILLLQQNFPALAMSPGEVDFRAHKYTPTPQSARVREAVSADFNNDGNMDVAATEDGPSIFLGDGKGRYTSITLINRAATTLTLGDFNNDGNIDLATGDNLSKWVLVFFGDGAGNFALTNQFLASTSNYARIRNILSRDFNNDGKDDLAVTSSDLSTGLVSVFLGNGSGGFSGAVNTSILGNEPLALTSGNFNNDQNEDLVVGYNFGNSVSVLLGNGQGGFSLSQLPLASAHQDIVVSDFNSDGNADMAIANIGNVFIFAGNGSGNFSLVFNGNFGSYYLQLAAADYNGDDLVDLVCGATTFQVLLNQGNNNFALLSQSYYVQGWDDVLAVDLNNDLIPDLVGVGFTKPALLNFLGVGDGQFIFSDIFPATSATRIVARDFNNDNKIDLATSNRLFIGDGKGRFSASNNINFGFVPLGMIPGDFNNDNNLDLAAISFSGPFGSVTLGNGSGQFSNPAPFNPGCRAESLAKGDFNRDGWEDLVFISKVNDLLTMILGQGNGQFSNPVTIGSFLFADSGVAVGDFNGDTFLDIVASHTYYDGYVNVYFGNGQGAFLQGGTILVAYGLVTNPHYIAVGRINGDNYLDLAIAIYNGSAINVLMGDGTGNFSQPVAYSVPPFPEKVELADVNNDGFLDIIANSPQEVITVLFNNGQGIFSEIKNFGTDRYPEYFASGDFNQDGLKDIATISSIGNAIGILHNTSPLEVPSQFPTIQGAVDAASNFGRVLVDAGTYNENIYFKGKSIKLKSKQGAFNTILDGSNIDAVISLQQGEKPWTSVEGFIIRNGNGMLAGNTGEAIAVPPGAGGATFARAGGININGVSPHIKDNIIINNVGIRANGVSLTDSLNSARLVGNILALNVNSSSIAGGVYSTMSNPILKGNILYEINCSVYATNNSKLNLGNIGNAGNADDGGNIITNICVVNNTPNEIKAENNYWGFPGNYLQTSTAVLQALMNNGNTGLIDVDPLGQ